MLSPRRRGFTIIELMVGVALIAMLLLFALPSFMNMAHNMKLRNTAESILSGLQTARLEALKRNQTVEFLLMASDPVPSDYATFAPNTTGPAWAVRMDPVTCTSGWEECYVDGRAALEGSNQADPAALNVQVAATALPGTTSIRFDGLGRTNVLAANGALFDVSNPTAGACRTVGGNEPIRCLRVVVTQSGRVRMCDPAVPAAAGETRAC